VLIGVLNWELGMEKLEMLVLEPMVEIQSEIQAFGDYVLSQEVICGEKVPVPQ
jgi:hypothetical protein